MFLLETRKLKGVSVLSVQSRNHIGFNGTGFKSTARRKEKTSVLC